MENEDRNQMIIEALGVEIAITPSDICNQEFKRSMMGGYDPEEVDVFLEKTANAMDITLRQIRELKIKVDEQAKALEEYHQIENTLRTALISSQKFNDDIIDSARREAKTMLEEARLKQAQIQMESVQMPQKLADEIKALEGQRNHLRREMLAILQTHRNLLDAMIPDTVKQKKDLLYPAKTEAPPIKKQPETLEMPVANKETGKEGMNSVIVGFGEKESTGAAAKAESAAESDEPVPVLLEPVENDEIDDADSPPIEEEWLEQKYGQSIDPQAEAEDDSEDELDDGELESAAEDSSEDDETEAKEESTA